MVTIPAAIQTAWDECVNDLAPFDKRVVITSAGDGEEHVCASGEIISLVVTRTLYDKASIGNTASSEMDMTFLSKPGEKAGKVVPGYLVHIGDRIDISIRPAASSDTGDTWVPQGTFYVLQVDTDAYTNASKILAVDVLTAKGESRFPVGYNNYSYGWMGGPSVDYDFEVVACNALGINREITVYPFTVNMNEYGYRVSGNTIRDVLSAFGGPVGFNYSVSYSNTLRRVQFNSSGTPFVLGRRAEKIERNGSWTDYEFAFSLFNDVPEVYYDPASGVVFTDVPQLSGASSTTNGNTKPMLLNTVSWRTVAKNPQQGGRNWPQMLADEYSLSRINRRQYDAFTCTNMVFDPALELGDQVTVLGKAQTSLLADDALNPMLWIEPGNDDTRTEVTQPHDYIPYWENQQNDNSLTGSIGKLVVDYKTPQIAQLLQSPAPQG